MHTSCTVHLLAFLFFNENEEKREEDQIMNNVILIKDFMCHSISDEVLN